MQNTKPEVYESIHSTDLVKREAQQHIAINIADSNSIPQTRSVLECSLIDLQSKLEREYFNSYILVF